MTQAEKRAQAKAEGNCIDCYRRKAKPSRIRCRRCLKAQSEAKVYRATRSHALRGAEKEGEAASVKSRPAQDPHTNRMEL